MGERILIGPGDTIRIIPAGPPGPPGSTVTVEVGPTPAEIVQGSGIVLDSGDGVTTIALGDRTADTLMGRIGTDGPPDDLTVGELKVLLDIDDLEFNDALATIFIQDNGWLFPMTYEPQISSTVNAMTSAPRTLYTRMSGKSGTALLGKATINIGTSSGNISVGVFANNGSAGIAARPAGRLLTTGEIPCPATGTQTVDFTSTAAVPAGAWLGISADNTVATFARANATIVLPGTCYLEAAHPAPAAAGTLTASGQRQWGAVHA